jgi:hypothetical protein
MAWYEAGIAKVAGYRRFYASCVGHYSFGLLKRFGDPIFESTRGNCHERDIDISVSSYFIDDTKFSGSVSATFVYISAGDVPSSVL